MKIKRYASKSHQGPYLNVNEDAVDVDFVNNLFMLFDGFGGSGVGDKAVLSLKEDIKTMFIKLGRDPDSTMPFVYSKKYLIEGNALLNALHLAHRRLYEANQKVEMSRRGGASGLFAAISENILSVASIGNSICYFYRHGELAKVFTQDNHLLLSMQEFSKDFKFAPLSGLGLFEDIQVQVHEIRYGLGDVIIFMSSGVYAKLQLNEVKHILDYYKDDYMKAIDNFFFMANSRGNLDNQSVIIVQF